ncbi:MAG: cobalamin biosynthesis protein CbiM [Spirochaetes bacterium RBG_16_49_21]|nr:MAG: cobalamin biosynthesis protein CbiM [Spirochaetes bacterium RBG_16_49_21]
MHIPDGYLSPQTYLPLYAAFAGFMAAALRKMKKTLSAKNIPYLGMASAFSFLIMMFNVPIPGGTTGHAVGAGIVALILGPWTALIAVSVALIIQALLFGDGGITAIGANCVNMAVVMPFVSVWVFKLFRGKAPGGWRVYTAAFLSGYAGLAAAAVTTAVEFGIQPLIASSNGRPLYAPYGLEIALPVMALEHLLLFCVIEGLVTMLVLRYFLKNDPGSVYAMPRQSSAQAPRQSSAQAKEVK